MKMKRWCGIVWTDMVGGRERDQGVGDAAEEEDKEKLSLKGKFKQKRQD